MIVKKYHGLLEDTNVIPFHCGSHYGNGTIVISYLLRFKPYAFTSLHIKLEGSKCYYAVDNIKEWICRGKGFNGDLYTLYTNELLIKSCNI